MGLGGFFRSSHTSYSAIDFFFLMFPCVPAGMGSRTAYLKGSEGIEARWFCTGEDLLILLE
jgi:hypothetical protein